MRQQNQGKPFSRSLRNIIASTTRLKVKGPVRLLTERSVERPAKGDLRGSMQVLQEARKKYDHQIDHLVRELAEQEQLPVEFPALLRKKNSYHNYRILSHRPQNNPNYQEDEEGEAWRRQVVPQMQREKRTKTEPREYDLSKERDRVYQVVKHYREGSLKKMELHLDMDQLRKWHAHNRDLALRREARNFKLPIRPQFHQLQLQ